VGSGQVRSGQVRSAQVRAVQCVRLQSGPVSVVVEGLVPQPVSRYYQVVKIKVGWVAGCQRWLCGSLASSSLNILEEVSMGYYALLV